MAATPYGPPPGFETHSRVTTYEGPTRFGRADESAGARPTVADFEPVPEPPTIPTDPVSKQAVFIGYATVTLPALLYNLAEAFDWLHLTDTQFAAVKAIYAFVVFSVAYWTASNVYSKASVAKIRAGEDVA
jgi:hypothetical protein